MLGDPRLELRFLLPEGGATSTCAARPVADATRRHARADADRARRARGWRMVLHDPAPRSARTCCAGVVEAAGLAIEIARLRVELRRQLDEVAASRARIVAAGDAERRRIERNLHDGAQQRLVSIGLALRHAQHELGPARRRAETLDGALAEIADAIGELRELAHGLPPVAARRRPRRPRCEELASRVAAARRGRRHGERFPDGVETAAYFIACEALTNATKHAHASTRRRSARSAATAASSSAWPTTAWAAPRPDRLGPQRPAPTASPPTAGRCGSRASAGPARA